MPDPILQEVLDYLNAFLAKTSEEQDRLARFKQNLKEDHGLLRRLGQ